MGSTPVSGGKGGASAAVAMGLSPGHVIQELGWDDDVDQDLREAIMDGIDATQLVDYESEELTEIAEQPARQPLLTVALSAAPASPVRTPKRRTRVST